MEKEPSKTTHRGHYEAAKLHTFTFDGKIQWVQTWNQCDGSQVFKCAKQNKEQDKDKLDK
jgi:hypothetical protein